MNDKTSILNDIKKEHIFMIEDAKKFRERVISDYHNNKIVAPSIMSKAKEMLAREMKHREKFEKYFPDRKYSMLSTLFDHNSLPLDIENISHAYRFMYWGKYSAFAIILTIDKKLTVIKQGDIVNGWFINETFETKGHEWLTLEKNVSKIDYQKYETLDGGKWIIEIKKQQTYDCFEVSEKEKKFVTIQNYLQFLIDKCQQQKQGFDDSIEFMEIMQKIYKSP